MLKAEASEVGRGRARAPGQKLVGPHVMVFTHASNPSTPFLAVPEHLMLLDKRKLPSCAVCGGRLYKSGRIVIGFGRRFPGSPIVGAHTDACSDDPLFVPMIAGFSRQVEGLDVAITRIAERGADRVTARPPWWKAHPPRPQLSLLDGGLSGARPA